MKTLFYKTLTPAILAILASTSLTACNKTIKPESRKPTKLVAVQNQVGITPVFSTKLDNRAKHSKGVQAISSKDTLDLQVGIGSEMLVVASRAGVVQGFNNGAAAWQVAVGEPIVSGVGFDEPSRTAIVATRTGKVIAFDSDTGAIRWTQDIKATVLAPATVAGNRVLISANNGVLYGLNLQSGASIWQFSTNTPNVSVRGTAKPLRLDGNTALFGTADGRITALASDTGTPLWTRRVGVAIGGSDVGRMSDVDGTPTVVGKYLFSTSFSGQFVGFDMSTGQTMFSQTGFNSTKPVAFLNQQLIGVDTNSVVAGFNPLTGEKLWETNELKHRKLSNPVTIGQWVALGDGEGFVHLIDSKGQIVARTQLKDKGQITSLQAYGDRLYAQSVEGAVAVWQVQ